MLTRYLPVGSDPADHTVSMPQCAISSSAIRAAVSSGLSIRYQTPAAVAAYIAQHHLYA